MHFSTEQKTMKSIGRKIISKKLDEGKELAFIPFQIFGTKTDHFPTEF